MLFITLQHYKHHLGLWGFQRFYTVECCDWSITSVSPFSSNAHSSRPETHYYCSFKLCQYSKIVALPFCCKTLLDFCNLCDPIASCKAAAAFGSKGNYLFGSIGMGIKLVPGNSAGTVTAYYVRYLTLQVKFDLRYHL